MIPPPVAVSLTLCNHVMVEEGGTRRVSLIGGFSRLRVTSFPATPAFYVFAALTDGLGNAHSNCWSFGWPRKRKSFRGGTWSAFPTVLRC